MSGPLEAVEEWRTAAPDRILASPLFGRPNVDFYGRPLPQIDELRSLFKSGRLSAVGEVVAQYEGLSPSDPALERGQCERLTAFKADRDMSQVEAVLDHVVAAARGTQNLMYPMKEALRANATLGEVSDALRGVFGLYTP